MIYLVILLIPIVIFLSFVFYKVHQYNKIIEEAEKKFDEESTDYVSFLAGIGDSVAVSEQSYNEAKELEHRAKISPYLAHIMYPKSTTLNLYQVPLYVTTTRHNSKVLVDISETDPENKDITPYDYKTFAASFLKTYWTYKYYYQEAWYGYMLEMICNHRDQIVDMNIPDELQGCEGYKVNQFTFIALDKSLKTHPEIFCNNHHIYEDIFFDNILKTRNKETYVKSISQIIDEIK